MATRAPAVLKKRWKHLTRLSTSWSSTCNWWPCDASQCELPAVSGGKHRNLLYQPQPVCLPLLSWWNGGWCKHNHWSLDIGFGVKVVKIRGGVLIVLKISIWYLFLSKTEPSTWLCQKCWICTQIALMLLPVTFSRETSNAQLCQNYAELLDDAMLSMWRHCLDGLHLTPAS